MKILVNTPNYSQPSSGGVASFYYGLLNYWQEDVKYNVIGTRRGIPGYLWMAIDIFKFILKIIVWRPDVILLNPSLNFKALKRDFIYLKLAHFFKRKTVVLFHGFDFKYAETAKSKWIKINLQKASLIFVLAHQFKEILLSWDIEVPIELMTTKVEDRMIQKFDINSRNGDIKNILFLARIEKEKGIYELLDSFNIIRNKHSYLQLTIVGGGSELKRSQAYAKEHKIVGVKFTGPLNGAARLAAYSSADLFLFPSYGEGMPTVVLEAMAFGLPVISRAVGGLCDFFINGKMGYITESFDPNIFANLVEKLISDKNLSRSIAFFNHEYAIENFMASKVCLKIEQTIGRYC